MKVVAFNGSPRGNGNTYTAIELVTENMVKAGVEVEIVHVGNQLIRGCLACNQCARNRDERCVIDDEVNEWIQKMKEADGILIGSPVHYSAIAGTMKSFLDRAFYVSGNNGSLLRHKVGAAVVAVRRSGGIPTLNQLNNFLNYSEMMMPTSNYWHVIHGTKPGDALEDAEGVQIMRVLGENFLYMLQMNTSDLKAPDKQRKVFTNFIR
ncbi:MAG: flavodoxin family protein [Clostridiales bacterium]|nr:flavodoxin family protein [Clostridiales bacterium]